MIVLVAVVLVVLLVLVLVVLVLVATVLLLLFLFLVLVVDLLILLLVPLLVIVVVIDVLGLVVVDKRQQLTPRAIAESTATTGRTTAAPATSTTTTMTTIINVLWVVVVIVSLAFVCNYFCSWVLCRLARLCLRVWGYGDLAPPHSCLGARQCKRTRSQREIGTRCLRIGAQKLFHGGAPTTGLFLDNAATMKRRERLPSGYPRLCRVATRPSVQSLASASSQMMKLLVWTSVWAMAPWLMAPIFQQTLPAVLYQTWPHLRSACHSQSRNVP